MEDTVAQLDMASIRHELSKTEIKQRIAQLEKELFAYLFSVAQGAEADAAHELKIRHDLAEAKELKYALAKKLLEIDLCVDCIAEENPGILQTAAPKLHELKAQLVTDDLVRSCLG